jgi:uncharacterized membrane protein YphA (DoxX/SURF4 family)
MKEKIAYLLLRVSVGIVFLAFGIGKFQGDIWAETIKNMDIFHKLPWSVDTTVLLIGAQELVTGLALLSGVFTRLFSAVAAMQLITILFLLNFQETRDVGLLGAAIYMAVVKDPSWNIWTLRRKACCAYKTEDFQDQNAS